MNSILRWTFSIFNVYKVFLDLVVSKEICTDLTILSYENKASVMFLFIFIFSPNGVHVSSQIDDDKVRPTQIQECLLCRAYVDPMRSCNNV